MCVVRAQSFFEKEMKAYVVFNKCQNKSASSRWTITNIAFISFFY